MGRKVDVYYLYHLRPDEIPSVSSSSLARIMTDIPEDVSSYLIHPFLGQENEEIKTLNMYLRTLRKDNNEFLENFDNLTQQEKKTISKETSTCFYESRFTTHQY